MNNAIGQENRKAILDALREIGEWTTANTIGAKVNITTSTARRHLNDLAETEAVEKRQRLIQLHKNEYRIIQLPEWWDA